MENASLSLVTVPGQGLTYPVLTFVSTNSFLLYTFIYVKIFNVDIISRVPLLPFGLPYAIVMSMRYAYMLFSIKSLNIYLLLFTSLAGPWQLKSDIHEENQNDEEIYKKCIFLHIWFAA